MDTLTEAQKHLIEVHKNFNSRNLTKNPSEEWQMWVLAALDAVGGKIIRDPEGVTNSHAITRMLGEFVPRGRHLSKIERDEKGTGKKVSVILNSLAKQGVISMVTLPNRRTVEVVFDSSAPGVTVSQAREILTAVLGQFFVKSQPEPEPQQIPALVETSSELDDSEVAHALLGALLNKLQEESEVLLRYHMLVDEYEQLRRNYDVAIKNLSEARSDASKKKSSNVTSRLSDAQRATLNTLAKSLKTASS